MNNKLKCLNPYCDDEVIQAATDKPKIYCCDKCKQAVEYPSAQLDQSGYLTLCNGMQVRNDAMGKEIAGNFGRDKFLSQ